MYFLLGLAALLLLIYFGRKFIKADPRNMAANLRKAGGVAALAAAAFLALRGAVLVAIPLAMFGMALLGRNFPYGFNFPGSGHPTPGQKSRVRTRFLEMELDHDTGLMSGRILEGGYVNRNLEEVPPADLMALWGEWRNSDPQSAQLLEAYLDRAQSGWRKAAGAGSERKSTSSDGPMTLDEAYEILGLRRGASADDIRRAHRELMKKLHPDRGGTTYLAAKLNAAKDLLLRGKR